MKSAAGSFGIRSTVRNVTIFHTKKLSALNRGINHRSIHRTITAIRIRYGYFTLNNMVLA